jgi:hypothetical protein
MIYDKVNWDSVIENLLPPENEVTTDPAKWKLETPGYIDIYNTWKAAEFNMGAVKWVNYYTGKHFDQKIIDDLAEFVGVTELRSWISRIDPGYFAPWHWDVDDHETEFLKHGKLKRFSCFIKKPAHGQIFILNDVYYYNQPQGTLVEWPQYNDWHAGINAGMSPKYMLHLIGY